jgi:hypothetical protein
LQGFFTEELGMPLTMAPDFETLGCLMTFGAAPPPAEDDPVRAQACLAGCTAGAPGGARCRALE